MDVDSLAVLPCEILPCKVIVKEIVASRYGAGTKATAQRPSSWDARIAGQDIVKTTDQQQIKLWSDGGQSPPKPGWILVITGGDPIGGYLWTLYGISSNKASSQAIRETAH